MKKRKMQLTGRKLMPFIFVLVVCVCTVVALGTVSYLQGKPFELVNDNGETYIPMESKADIVGNIYAQDGKLVILEVVPYDNAGIMDMLVGTSKVKSVLEADKEALYKEFISAKVDYDEISEVTIGGSIASYHPFTINYDRTTGEYTLNYISTFLGKLVDPINDNTLYTYLLNNTEVRTVRADKLTKEDLEGVSLIYLAGDPEASEVVNFNRYINGEIKVSGLSSLKAENFGYTHRDMSWDMVEYITDYVYAGNEYTDGQPVPCIVNYDKSMDTSSNLYKLANIILKTSNEEDARYKGVSTYYKNIMSDISQGVYTYEGKEYSDWSASGVPFFDLRCTLTNNYMFNFAYKTQNSVKDILFYMGCPDDLFETVEDNGTARLRGVALSDDNTYTTAGAVRYLLAGGGDVENAYSGISRAGRAPAEEDDEIIRVLEIEPCLDYMYYYSTSATTDYFNRYTSKEQTYKNIKDLGIALGLTEYSKLNNENKYKKLLDDGKARIEFTCVTPQEFNGMNDDLVAAFDIIFIGTKTGEMNTDSSGKTIYNDNELDGYKYLAYGDLVKCRTYLVGFLPDEFRALDISTITNYNGFTIDTSANLGLTDWDGHNYLYSIQNKAAWPSLLSNTLTSSKYWILKKHPFYSTRNEYYADDFGNARLLANDITNKKLEELEEFIDISRPIVVADDLYKCPSESNKAAYPTSNIYKFVSSKGSESNVIPLSEISAKLNDVVHDSVLEIVSYTMQYEESGVRKDAPAIEYDSNNLLKNSCIIDGIEQFYYNLTFKAEPGKKYYVKAIVDKNTDGRFKSEATVDDFNEVYYAQIVTATTDTVTVELNIRLAEGYNGMFAWKLLVEELNNRNVKVDAVSTQGYTVVRGETKNIKALQITPGSTELDMSANGTFKTLLTSATGKINYNVQIETITASNFEKKFIGNPYTKGESYNTSADYLKSNDYTMIILGFKDSWGGADISDDNGALSCIMDYMENGNSVLMSHDVLTFYYSPNWDIQTENYGYWQNGRWNTGTKLIKSHSGYGSYCVSLRLRELIGMDVYGVTTIPDLSDATLDAANVPQKADGSYIREIQGFTNWHIYRYNYKQSYSTTKNNYVQDTLRPFKDATYMPTGNNTDVVGTTVVNEVNRGQISMYPYNTTAASGTLKVALTHPQYFRLNMEDDDLVVWYTLGYDGGSGNNQFYRDSGKDAANNYYIYSKGNITYSGAGHSGMNSDSNKDELKLFVNTTIRAAMAGNFVPKVTVKNGSSTKEADTFVIFPSALDDKITVTFVPFDEDLATREVVQDTYSTEEQIREHIGRFQQGAIYYQKEDGTKLPLYTYSRSVQPYLLNGEEHTVQIYDPFPGITGAARDAAKSSADAKTRNMAECYDDYLEKGTVDIVIEVKDYAGATGSSTVKIVEHELFKLD